MRAAALLIPLCFFLGCNGTEPTDTDTPATADPAAPPLVWETVTREDSVALRDGGPYFTYRLATLKATGGDAQLREVINDSIAAYVLGESLSAGGNFEERLDQDLARRMEEYRTQEVEEEWLQEAPNSFTESEEQETEVVFQNDRLIVLAHHFYAYTGGAHGNYATRLLAFATDPPRGLTAGDLFRPGSEASLRRLLTRRADSLTEGGLYVDPVPVTDNLAPLPGGIRFLYPPYEIAPYAVGEVVIELDYATLRPWLRPGVEALAAE